MCKGGSPAQQQSTSMQTSSPPNEVYSMYSDMLKRAQGVSNTPYTPYGGELTAGLSPTQQAGIGNVNQGTGMAMPAFQQAIGIAGQAASPLTQQDVQQWVNPWTQNVVDATQNQFNNQNSQQQQQLKGNQIAQGALGNSRNAVSQGILSNQQQLAQAPVIAGLNSQGYQQGVNTALAAKGSAMSGAQGLAGLGAGAQNIGMQQLGAGGVEQQTQQAADTAMYQQWLNKQAYPYQQTQWLAGLGTGVGSQMGGTTVGNSQGTSAQAGPSPTSQILGAGTSMASMAMMMGLATGGRVKGFAGGGRAEGVAGSPQTIPESLDTLMLQQQQLIDGQRKVQMFPIGTPELPLPRGLQRLETPAGILHYNPSKISFEELQHLIEAERENEFLGLGPHNKQAIHDRIQKGEQPFALVERNPEGIEARAALGTHSTLPEQWEAMNAEKSPDHELHLEDPMDTLQRRCGGSIPGFASGGAPGMGEQAQGVAGSPYFGSMGWIPTIGLAKGNTIPQTAGAAPSMKDPGVSGGAPNMDSVGALGKSIFDSLRPQEQGGNYDANLGEGFVGPTGFKVGGNAFGGRVEGVKGYALGGGPWDDGGPIPGNWNQPQSREEQLPPGSFEQPPVAGVAPAPPMQGFGDVAPVTQDVPVQGFGEEKPITSGNGLSIPLPRERPIEAQVQEAIPAMAEGVNAPPSWAGDKRVPRGIRNNNAGNIEDGPFARSQPGYVGGDGRFAKFESPKAGLEAASALLQSYGNKGFNTINSIINRWAPAADNNDVGAYARAVSKNTGFAPDEPLDMNDPAVRGKLSLAMAMHENGTGAAGLNPASGYNRGVVPASEDSRLPSNSTPAGPLQTANGVAGATPPSKSGVDWSSNSKLWPALLTAGLGMMASRSPHAGVAIGEGGLAGLGSYTKSTQTATENAFERERLDRAAKQLSNTMDYQNRQLAQTDRHHNEMTPYQKQQLEISQATQKRLLQQEQDRLAEVKRAHDMAVRQPIDTGAIDPETYAPIKLLPRPRPDGSGELDYFRYNHKNGKMEKVEPDNPLLQSLPGQQGGNQQGGGQPGQPQGGLQKVAFEPDSYSPELGTVGSNTQLATTGNYDYSHNAPLMEKGMAVPEPKEIAGHSVQTIKAEAEKYLQTGVAPKVAVGNSPTAKAQYALSTAVKNYGNALAASKGMTPAELAEAWRAAPSTQKYITGKGGDTIISLGTAVRHLDTMRDLAKAWDEYRLTGKNTTLNKIQAAISREFGNSAASNLETAATIVGPEIIKAIGVAGAGTQAERVAQEAFLSPNVSSERILGSIGVLEHLLGGQLTGKMNQAREAGLSEERFKRMIGERPYEVLTKANTKGGSGGHEAPKSAPGALPPGVPQGSVSGMKGGKPVWRTPDGTFIPKEP